MLKLRNFRVVLENTEISGSVEEIKNVIDFVYRKQKRYGFTIKFTNLMNRAIKSTK